MLFEKLSPYIRFAKAFSYFPTSEDFIAGYDYRLFYIRVGRIFLKFKDTEHLLDKHSVAVIPPGYFYRLVSNDGSSVEIICLNFDTVKGEGRPESSVHPLDEKSFDNSKIFEKDLIDALASPVIVHNCGILRDRLSEITKEFASGDFGYRIKSEALLAAVTVSLVRSNKCSFRKEARLAVAVREFLNDSLSEQIDSRMIGEKFHYHPNYINRIFKEATGMTLHSYIIKLRIDTAKQLLVSSNFSLEKIAVRCGFKTLSHFSQCFKQNTGISPKDYRSSSERLKI